MKNILLVGLIILGMTTQTQAQESLNIFSVDNYSVFNEETEKYSSPIVPEVTLLIVFKGQDLTIYRDGVEDLFVLIQTQSTVKGEDRTTITEYFMHSETGEKLAVLSIIPFDEVENYVQFIMMPFDMSKETIKYNCTRK